MLTVAQAELLGLILHTALFGIYIVLFIQSLPFSTDEHDGFKNKFRTSNHGLLAANLILFVTIVAHWVVQIIRSQRAFIDTAGKPLLEGHDPATLYYATPQDYMNLLKEALYLTQTFVGDCTMVYRAWIIWNKRFSIIILPAFIMIGFAVSAVGVVVALARLVPGQDIFASAANAWAITVFTTSVTTNIVTTSLIIYRILSIRRRVAHAVQSGPSRVMEMLMVLVESALLYTVTAVSTLIGYTTKENWQFITIDMISPIIGISFTLIVVRVQRQTNSSTRGQTSKSNQMARRAGTSENIGLHAISVTVTQDIERDYDDTSSSGKNDLEHKTRGLP